MMNGLLCGMFMHMKSNNRNSREVVEHRTKSLKPALGAWSNVIQEVTIHLFTVTAVCGKHVKSSADVASLSRRLCSARADSVAMSGCPYTQKWEISICNL